mmetsp:Transcript_36309/g.53181  ORF Transcript_36309/g.53181 Transcript_36309/m.53181 type:complete len:1051 (-) Transcript_36309:507-3659(-)
MLTARLISSNSSSNTVRQQLRSSSSSISNQIIQKWSPASLSSSYRHNSISIPLSTNAVRLLSSSSEKEETRTTCRTPNVPLVVPPPTMRRYYSTSSSPLLSSSPTSVLLTSLDSGGFYKHAPHHHHHQSMTTSSLLFQKTMQNVMIRAFSTTPPPSSSEDKTSPSSSSASSSQSFSTTTTTPKASTSIPAKVKDVIISASQSLASLLASTPSTLWFYMTHPKEFKEKMSYLKELAKKEAHHYWMGFKLLAADIRTAKAMLKKTLQGSALTRRERKQLLRTLADLFRIVPMSIFVIIPFMEFALPFALRIWPNMLPSTFQDSLKAEENMKRELQSRISLAGFFQETLQEMAKDQKRNAASKKKNESSSAAESSSESTESGSSSYHAKKEESAAAFLEFLEKSRKGEMMPPDVIIKYSNYFHDELTLDNMPRMQLINMCKYMAIPPYGSNNLLRFQLRHRIRTLKEDDQRILWEGIESLTKMELREACRERGMRSTGLSKDSYRRALQQWLDLSVNKNVPISLLIMSRTFFLQDEMVSGVTGKGEKDSSVASLAEAMSGLDKDLVNEIVLEMATPQEKASSPEIRKIQLEVLEHQNEIIKEEQEEREKAQQAASSAKKSSKKEKEKAAAVSADAKEEVVALPEAKATPKVAVKKAEDEKVEIADEMMADTTKITFETTASPELDIKAATTTTTTPDAALDDDNKMEEEKKAKMEADKDTKEDKQEVKKEDAEEVEEEEDDEEEEEEEDLSASDIDAISQLASRNPVQSERDDLERIKAAMMLEDSDKKEKITLTAEEAIVSGSEEIIDVSAAEKETVAATATVDKDQSEVKEEIVAGHEDLVAAKTIAEMDAEAEKEATSTTAFSTEGEIKQQTMEDAASATVDTTATLDSAEEKIAEEEADKGSGDEKLDKAINRLKSRVQSMVVKIESQLEDVESKIGDKLHLLDKDMDGVVTVEEVAASLRTILKRDLTEEQARAIAADMDQNEDGVLTVKELAMWAEINKVIKLMEEGRDAEVDRLLIEKAEKLKALEDENYPEETLAEVKKEKANKS